MSPGALDAASVRPTQPLAGEAHGDPTRQTHGGDLAIRARGRAANENRAVRRLQLKTGVLGLTLTSFVHQHHRRSVVDLHAGGGWQNLLVE